jgi:enterochelin esterase-like enzyme
MRIEPDDDSRYRRVTFTWTDPDPHHPAEDVLLRLHTLTDKARADRDLSPFLMTRCAGAWTLTVRLRADYRSAYQFCPSARPLTGRTFPDSEEDEWLELMGRGVADPANPATFGAIWANPGPTSLLELPDALPQPWVERRPGTPAGETTEHELASEILGKPRKVWIYTPAGAEGVREPSVAVLLDGDDWYHDFPSTLDNLVAHDLIPPTVAVMVDSVDGETRMKELTGHEAYLRFLLDEVMPWAYAGRRISRDPGRTVIAGQSLGGLMSAYAGLHAPHRFGLVLSQSGSFWWPGGSEFDVEAGVITRQFVHLPRQPIRIWMEAGLIEWTLRDQNRHLRDVLQAKGYDVTYREYHGGHDNACWRGGLADGLISLLGDQPPGAAPPAQP